MQKNNSDGKIPVLLSHANEEKERLNSILRDFALAKTRMSYNQVRQVSKDLNQLLRQTVTTLPLQDFLRPANTKIHIDENFWKRVRGII